MMDNTHVQATKELPLSVSANPLLAGVPTVRSIRKTGLIYWLQSILRPLASLRLTVTLFALSIVLVFCGTLAQVDAGIWTVIDKYFRSWTIVWIPLQLFFPRDVHVGGAFPFPGGWLLGSLLLVNLFAAHAVRFKFTWKRSGIIILHAGLIIMLLSELITGKLAVENSMLIHEGQSANYLTHQRETELAVVEEGAAENAEVAVVPMAILQRGGAIADHQLPFDVEVLQYMVNSRLCKLDVATEFLPHDFSKLPLAPSGTMNRATAGLGAKLYVAVDQRETGGMDQNKEDRPAAYVRLRHKKTGEDLGAYLLGVLLDDTPQYVSVDGKKYDVRLRLKRTYTPYTVHLIKFTHDKYEGTEKPKDFASEVRLLDPVNGVDRKVRIYMNNPLFYGGETFYQQSFLPGDKATILQVVRNPGWPLPYLSFFMVGVGLLIHFTIKLVGFLQTATLPSTSKGMVDIRVATGSIIPTVIVAGLAAVFLIYKMIPPGDAADRMQISEAGKLPVLDGGRVMPLDSVARNSLMIISARQTFVDGNDTTQPAIKWLLDVMTSRNGKGPAFDHKVFRIENDQLLGVLKLKARKGFRYSYAEIESGFLDLDREFNRVRTIPSQERDVFENKVAELAMHVKLFQDLNTLEVPKVIPPVGRGSSWFILPEAIQMQQHHNVTPKGTSEFTMMLIAYTRQDAKEFNSYLEAYRKLVDKDLPTETSRAGFEAFFNYFEPFYTCAVLYAVVFVLAFIGFVLWCANAKSGGSQVRQAALALLCLTLIVHTFALFGRMYLMDRPMVFVTNLYSSAIFIGWGCALLGLGLEFVYRMGLGNVVAAVGGFASLLIAQILSASGDTMEMMQAVLDTNFWLSTHVTCVTFGYSATFVAGLLGIVMILLSTFTNLMDRPLTKVLGSMIYGILCFALFFSFVGTVLGGLWADYSWGRFWGWDPKENGALLIVIWNALILHARWCGLVQQRGMAVLAIGGNIITSWSWFGVNMLGIGLHSYASASGANWLAGFAVSQLVLIGIGCLPLRKWPTPQTAKT